nr:potassium channel subfamily K member 9-like [Lytechinus pictus]
MLDSGAVFPVRHISPKAEGLPTIPRRRFASVTRKKFRGNRSYGHSAPLTIGGKIFCMIYALVGIPLNLVMFQSVGERLNVFMGFGVKKIKKCLRFKKCSVSHTELVIIGGIANVIITVSGAVAFVHFEKWGFVEAFYYVIITLTTVGFGDYVALQKDNDIQQRPQYVFFSIIYILVALVVLASVMNLLVLRLLTLNTEDERREAQEQELAMRQSGHELNHIDSHMNFFNHNHARGPLLAKGEHRAFCSTCSCNSKAPHRTNPDAYAVDFSIDAKGVYGNNFNPHTTPAVYNTLYSDDAEVFEQFLCTDRTGKRASI